jgi:glycolate dehydrogenase FAD-binding subunit
MSTSATLTIEDAIAHLGAIIGQEYAYTREELIAVSPADARQIAEVLRFANGNGLAVTPAGGGTKSAWGSPVAAHIQLKTERMQSVREHSWQDMTCTVDAGCTWAALQAELKRHGQMVSLDPLWPDRATVGGIVAVSDSGTLRLKYGGLRDLIIGMTIVLANGTIAKTGGKVVKNVAGYDLHKLMTGSFGTLGVIAEVNFRLHPLEEHVRTWSAAARDEKQFDAAFRALLDSQIVPSSVQIRADNVQCSVDIRIAAVPECLDKHALELEKIFRGFSLREPEENVWKARQDLFDANHAVIVKASVLPGEVCAHSADLQQHAAANGFEIHVVAQANGLITAAFGAASDAVIACIENLRKKVHASGGSVVVLQLPDELRSRLDVWGGEFTALPLMREIKRRFDPKRILNPCRFVGNI